MAVLLEMSKSLLGGDVHAKPASTAKHAHAARSKNVCQVGLSYFVRVLERHPAL